MPLCSSKGARKSPSRRVGGGYELPIDIEAYNASLDAAPISPSPYDVNAAFDKLDIDGDGIRLRLDVTHVRLCLPGVISRAEFKAAMLTPDYSKKTPWRAR